jgi:hypothetical protein
VRIVKDNGSVVRKFTDVISSLVDTEAKYSLLDCERYNVPMWSVEKTFTAGTYLYDNWEYLVGDLPSTKVNAICIPEWVKTSYNKNIFMSFLCGLIDTDGSCGGNKVQYATISEKMVDDLCVYCPLYGIYPWKTSITADEYNASNKTGYRAVHTSYKVYFNSHEFWNYSSFLQNDKKREKILEDQKSRKYLFYPLTVPSSKISEEEEKLWAKEDTTWGEKTKNLSQYNQRYHFRSKLGKTGSTCASVYNRNGVSFQHLLHYDKVIGIETELDITENFKDITVEDNNSYFTGEGSYFVSHNCGYRILPEDINKLPVVKHALITRKDTKDADYVIPDSREGWIKLLGKVLKAHFYSGQGFTYSCTLLRSKGAPIKTFGGLSSGPEILCDGMDKISSVLNKRVGQKIRPVDALDIMNIIGYIVVSG